MILWIIVILVVLTFAGWLLIKNKILSMTLGTIFTVLLIASISLLSANMHSHYGMEKVTKTTTHEVYSITPEASPVKAVAVKKIGSQDFVLVYKDKATDKEAKPHFVPNKKKIVESTKKSATYDAVNIESSQLVTKKTTWEYKSDTYKKLFNLGKQDNLVKEQHTLLVPKSWMIMNK
ncbi:DUF4811 domain-containing protein [Fructilactobacillus sp. Tb1]|uniref:DUF4811 domain-containing protein n=1 Tax=Fructilactobacillus sp. Tb1 TaxID=3422304 RepID=UPI003D2AF7A9